MHDGRRGVVTPGFLSSDYKKHVFLVKWIVVDILRSSMKAIGLLNTLGVPTY